MKMGALIKIRISTIGRRVEPMVDDHAVVARREHLRRGRLVYPRIVTATATAVSTTAPGRCVQSR